MITLTIRVKLILKAFGYAVAILGGLLVFALIVWAATSNQDLTTCTIWGSPFLGILAVLTDELKKREGLLMQHAHERSAVAAPSYTPVLTEYAPGTHQVSTKTAVDLNLGVFDPKLALRTDSVRSRCVPSQYEATHTLINQITQD